MRLPVWTIAVVALLVLGYALPYTLFAGVERWSGAFAFWLAFGAVVWVILVVTVSHWRPEAAPARRAPRP
jgi:hypothetical protein